MKLIVVSDIHGRHTRLSALLDMHKDADALIFLGDGLNDLARADIYTRGLSVIAVRGNCDGFAFFGNDAPTENIQSFCGFRCFMLHGHTRGVKSGLGEAVEEADRIGADILLFGHTHRPLEKYLPEGSEYGEVILKKPLRIFNPGSLGEGSFGIIDIRGDNVLMSHGSI